MLHQLTPRDIVTIGNTDTRTFKIKASGKAFRILIDGLYSDKIGAVVRELISNAADSHVKAGNAEPMLITYPSAADPTFRVRDFGTGMPHELVMDNYSTLFESTKENDDSQIGKLGLGSKSPFAYTDAFTLSCFDGASVRRYMIYINEEHIPVITYAGAEESTEPRGVEVGVAVEFNDFHAFRVAINGVVRDLDTLPEVIGAEDLKPAEKIKSGEGWWITGQNGWGFSIYARQGQISYAVDGNRFLHVNDLRNMLPDARRLVLDFPPNTLGFTASRESLEYTPETMQRIQNRIDEVVEALSIDMRDRLSKARSGWDLRCELTAESAWMVVQFLSLRGAKFRGEPLGRYVQLDKNTRKMLTSYTLKSNRFGAVTYPTFLKSASTGFESLEPSTTLLYFYDTSKPVNNLTQRVYHDAQQRTGTKRIIIARYSTPYGYKRLLAALQRPGDKYVFHVSQLADPPKDATRTKPSKPYSNATHLTATGTAETKIDLDEGGYYFVWCRGDIFKTDSSSYTIARHTAWTIWEAVKTFGGLPGAGDVYLLTPSQAARVKDRDNWYAVADLAKAVEARYGERSDMWREANVRAKARIDFGSSLYDRILERLVDNLANGQEPDARFGSRMCALVRNTHKARIMRDAFGPDFRHVADLCHLYGTAMPLTTTASMLPDKANKLKKQVLTAFPLLDYLQNTTDLDLLWAEYISPNQNADGNRDPS